MSFFLLTRKLNFGNIFEGALNGVSIGLSEKRISFFKSFLKKISVLQMGLFVFEEL